MCCFVDKNMLLLSGKGLGKNENGISEALKPKLKRSVSGVGHDLAADFTEHWWNNLYNKAAKNVEVLCLCENFSIELSAPGV